MADVAGRPFLERLLARLEAGGIRRVVLCVGHMGEVVRTHFGDGSYLGLEIAYSEDPEPLGTGGALRKALPLFETDPVLVLNGDSYCDVNPMTFFAWHVGHKAIGSLVLSYVQDTGRFGRVRTSEDGLITQFDEKGYSKEGGWINAGVYLLSHDLIGSIPGDRSVSIEREVFPQWAGRGLYGYLHRGCFLDIGTPESLLEANRSFCARAQ